MSVHGILRELNLKDMGWSRVAGPEGAAFFPISAKDFDAWESRCLQMHAAQSPLALAAKPLENNLSDRQSMVRGD